MSMHDYKFNAFMQINAVLILHEIHFLLLPRHIIARDSPESKIENFYQPRHPKNRSQFINFVFLVNLFPFCLALSIEIKTVIIIN